MKIQGVSEGSPAEKGGLKGGDVIIGLGGKKVGTIYDFMETLSAHKPGDEVEVVVQRDGKEVKLRVKLGTRSGSVNAPRPATTVVGMIPVVARLLEDSGGFRAGPIWVRLSCLTPSTAGPVPVGVRLKSLTYMMGRPMAASLRSRFHHGEEIGPLAFLPPARA